MRSAVLPRRPRTRCGAAPSEAAPFSNTGGGSQQKVAVSSAAVALSTSCVARLFVDQLRFDWLRPFDASESTEGVGTASVLERDAKNGDLYLLTAYHVVQDCERVWASFSSLGKERFEAHLLGAAPQVDSAVLLVRGTALQRVPRDSLARIGCLELGDSDAVRVGDEVLALGFPMSEFSVWSTKGVIAGRQGSNAHFQIDATINPGNSGGPLVDASGRQIGIVVAGRRDAEGMGYATPISQVRPRIEAILQQKQFVEEKSNEKNDDKPLMIAVPSFNAILGESSDALLRSLSVPQSETGTYVRYVMPRTALSSHMRAGDVMLRVDGCPIDNHGYVQVPWWSERMHVDTLLLNASLGESFNFRVWRNGEPHDFDAVLDQSDEFGIRVFYPQFERIDYETFGGIVVMMLTANHLQSEPALRARYMQTIADPDARARSFLVVTDIQSGSSLSGLPLIERGDQLIRVNGRAVATLEDYRAALLAPMRNDAGSWFVRWETRDGQATVLDYATALRETLEFGQRYNYRPSTGTKQVLRYVLNSVKQKQAPADMLHFAHEFASKS